MLMKKQKVISDVSCNSTSAASFGRGASSAQETGITSSDPQEPTTISEENKSIGEYRKHKKHRK